MLSTICPERFVWCFFWSDELLAIRYAHDQVLIMSALINCVELKESANNCAAMASLAVRMPPSQAMGQGMFGGEKRKQQQQPGLGDGFSPSRCLAPQFLAKLLIRCTKSFAHQLETERPDGDGEAGAASPAPARAPQPGRGTTGYKASKDGAAASPAPAAAPGVEPVASATPSTPQLGDAAEQSMSHSEGSDLVLGGHCALLLGLLVRDQERNRCRQRRRGFAKRDCVYACTQPRVAALVVSCPCRGTFALFWLAPPRFSLVSVDEY